MAIQTATTGQLENAQRTVIAKARYTAEHSAPCVALVENLSLGQGEKAMTIPKVGQVTFENLADGIDMTATQAIGMTTADLTTGEVGAKFIITDKLARQENESVFSMIGRQLGDGFGRKQNRDVIALYSALNSGTTLGADDKNLTAANAGACIAWARANKLPNPIAVVHHPYAIYYLTSSVSIVVGATYPIPSGFAEDQLRDFWKFSLSGVGFFETGDIDKIAAVDSGYGAIFSKSAMCVLTQKGYNTERERDASLRATEVVVTADYGCWELDNGYGAPMRYEIGSITTSA